MTVRKAIIHDARRILFLFLTFRIHISLIFFFILLHNDLRSGHGTNWALIVSFSLWHFALYLFDRVFDAELDRESQPDEYVLKTHRLAAYIAVFASLVLSFAAYILSGAPLIFWMLMLPVTFLYTLPIKDGTRIKNIFVLKNVFSAVVIWAFPLYVQHVILSNNWCPDMDIVRPILSLAIYVLVGEVFWDIRDLSVDLKHGISTIPNRWGIPVSKIYILLLLTVDSAISGWSLPFSGALYLVLLPFTKEHSDRLIFHLPPLIALIRFVV